MSRAIPMPKLKTALRYLLAVLMMAIGVMHFVRPEGFVAIVPKALPSPLALVYISGVFEILGGAGLLVPRVRRAAAWGLVLLFIAVFPANINMAVNQIQIPGTEPMPVAAMWIRLPFQLVLIAWAFWLSRPDKGETVTEQPAPIAAG